MTRFARLAVAAAALSLVLIAVGGIVRTTGSGLGCPDWPGCTTQWDVHAWIEYSHRAVAGVLAVVVLAVAVASLRRRPRDAPLVVASFAALALVAVQASLGAVVVLLELRADLVTLHLGLALALAALHAVVAERALRGPLPSRAGRGDLALGAALVALTVFVQALLGVSLALAGAGLAFRDFPLMDGALLPALANDAQRLHFAHRGLAALLSLAVLALAWRALATVRDRPTRRLALTALALVAAQLALGAANVWSGLSPLFVVPHLLAAAGLLVTLLILALSARRVLPAEAAADHGSPGTSNAAVGAAPPAGRPRWRAIAGSYLRLTKPRIIELLLVTTLPAMILAERGLPSPGLVVATLLGGTLAAGGANTINSYIDRGIDRLMARTRGRPLPRQELPAGGALAFGIGLGVAAVAWLWLTVNPLSALLAAAAIVFYVGVYTLGLKRRTPQNIVVGGAAGCVPVLVGWSAVTGEVGVPALVLFAIVFYWTPPHFWALALRYRGDYAAAGVPMLPVVRGTAETGRQIVLYSGLLAAVSLLLVPAAGMGAIYLVAAILLGAIFLAYAIRVWRELGRPRAASGLFRFSIRYLALLFAAVAVDSLVHLPLA